MTDDKLPDVPMPKRIKRLRRMGEYPVPFFVQDVDGKPDFRVIRPEAFSECVNKNLCWICGQRLGVYLAFVAGPMCAINRVSSEPPSHRDCAIYAAKVCPFMVNPAKTRREENLPEGAYAREGHIARNPGVSLVWITKDYRPFTIPNGVLFKMGAPVDTAWFTKGRRATVAEIIRAIDEGLPALRELAALDGGKAEQALNAAVDALKSGLDEMLAEEDDAVAPRRTPETIH